MKYYDKIKDIKMWLMTVVLLVSSSAVVYAADNAVKLEEGFKLGPAVIMIGMIILFIVVGLKYKAKGHRRLLGRRKIYFQGRLRDGYCF